MNFRTARVTAEEIAARRDRKTLTHERIDKLNAWLRAKAVEEGLAPSIASELRVAWDRDPAAVRR